MYTIPANILSHLQETYSITEEKVSFFEKNRFIKLKQVLNSDTLHFFNKVISDRIEAFRISQNIPLEERDTYGKAFLQVMNLWREDAIIRELIFSKRIAEIASRLMRTKGVRLYHDQALFKEPGGGITPWHADQFYWPLATDKTITAWIPLQAVPLEMGPLEFSAGSHRIVEGRELAISDSSEQMIQERLRVTDFEHVIEPFDAGEISFHSGWVFHRAGANQSEEMRKVMTIIYMDSEMRLKAPENSNQQNDWDTWCPGAIINEIIETPLNPLLYPGDSASFHS
ncbi:MAG: phytanoyl-CoA dioxygenase family protein [Chitinophagia bacterium]|jgi:ectoine hydroxylase-related dioxygenase (phytanoyl-CoA dioxygenase family)